PRPTNRRWPARTPFASRAGWSLKNEPGAAAAPGPVAGRAAHADRPDGAPARPASAAGRSRDMATRPPAPTTSASSAIHLGRFDIDTSAAGSPAEGGASEASQGWLTRRLSAGGTLRQFVSTLRSREAGGTPAQSRYGDPGPGPGSPVADSQWLLDLR